MAEKKLEYIFTSYETLFDKSSTILDPLPRRFHEQQLTVANSNKNSSSYQQKSSRVSDRSELH